MRCPIQRFCAYIPEVNDCVKKRESRMADYDSRRNKVRNRSAMSLTCAAAGRSRAACCPSGEPA